MSEHFQNRKNEVALRRFAAVSFIEQKVREGFGVVEALRLAALRPWPDENGQYSSARTLEDYWYGWKSGGFAALQPKSRGDEGTFRKLPTEVGQWLLSQVSQYPEIPLKVLYERWTVSGQQLPSLRTLYRFLRSKGYDAASLRRGRLTNSWSQSVRELHELYCHLTAQTLGLRFDRERLWYEFLRAGFGAADLKRVVTYLQKQIRAERRNIGALKLSNLLQLDRFEEDLNISRVRLKPPAPRPNPSVQPLPDPQIDDQQRHRILDDLRSFRQRLRRNGSAP